VAAFLVNNDVIRGDETIPNALTMSPETFISDRAVRYDQEQSLTVAEQQRARDNIGVDGTVEVAKSIHTTVRAEVAIQKGQAVYISGASGSNKKVRLAKADTEATSSKTIGLSSENLAVNGSGDIVTEGSLSGLSIDVSALTVAEGDPVWLSPTTAGGLLFGAANKPVAPNHMVFLGIVTRITGNTLTDIFVKVQNGFELQELHNVQITSPATGQALLYDAVAGVWKNQAISSELQELQDVQITSPAAGETLVYDAVTGLWKNQPSGSGDALPLAGGTMDAGSTVVVPTSGTDSLTVSGSGIAFDNGSSVRKGTTDAGLGGSKGVALKCSLDYEFKWEAGRLYTMGQDGFTIRRVDHCGIYVPTPTDDSTKGFVVGSIWTLDDGTCYECTNATADGATWAAHFPFERGDGLTFDPSTNTVNTSTNVARRAGNQTFSGNNTFGSSVNGVATTFFGTQEFNGSRTFAGASSFSGQVELTSQAATNPTSALTRELGDARYGVAGVVGNIYSGIKVEQVVAADNTPVTLASVTLPVGTYQIDSIIGAFASATGHGGYLFTIRASSNIRAMLMEYFGTDGATTTNGATFANDGFTTFSRSVTTNTVLSYRRNVTGIIDVLTAGTVLSIEFSQASLITQPAPPAAQITITTRKRAFIIARKIA
jgi:hypothetical protein